MPGKMVVRYIDNSGERSIFSVYTAENTAGNIVAQKAAEDALINAIGALSIGNLDSIHRYSDYTELLASPPASQLAQRENKYMCQYHDTTTGKKFRAEFPCADLLELPSGEEELDLLAGNGATLKSAFEALVVSPDDETHTVVLDRVVYVARNL